ncbi:MULTISPECIES: hypothetical protein [Exiguobacterium]|uniref:hypothetical protein n=1 Tax=Exiguobacterium TaxID=33986 RepID=UPI000A4F0D54|nr:MULTISPECIES: hypothetical protein [Exiguobacterium]
MEIIIQGRTVRKACVRLSSVSHTGLDYFMRLPLRELVDFITDVQEVKKNG